MKGSRLAALGIGACLVCFAPAILGGLAALGLASTLFIGIAGLGVAIAAAAAFVVVRRRRARAPRTVSSRAR